VHYIAGDVFTEMKPQDGETLAAFCSRVDHLVDTVLLLNPALAGKAPGHVLDGTAALVVVKDLPFKPCSASKKITYFIDAVWTCYCSRHAVIRTVSHLADETVALCHALDASLQFGQQQAIHSLLGELRKG
jgi:hypothetical protein